MNDAAHDALLLSKLSHDELMAVLVRLPACTHATAVAVCSRFKVLLDSQEFKIQRLAAGCVEQFLVAAGGYGGDSCATAGCSVKTASGWARLPDLPRHVEFGADGTEGLNEGAAVVVGDTFYLLGGEGSGEPATGTACVFSIQPHLFNNEALAWRCEPSMPVALLQHVAGVHKGVIVVAGGREDPTEQAWYGEAGAGTASTYLFDTGTELWTEGARMPRPRVAAVGAVVNGTLHVMGGFDLDWGRESDDDGRLYDEYGRLYDGDIIFSYDIEADAWTERTPTGGEAFRGDHEVTSAVAKDGKVYVIAKTRFYLFDPLTFTLTRGPDLPSTTFVNYGGLRLGVFHGAVMAVGQGKGGFVLDEDQSDHSWRPMVPGEGDSWHICPMTNVATVYK